MPLLDRYSSLPASAVKLTSDPDSIRTGVLFVHAPWSGQSVAAFRTLTDLFASLPDRPLLYLANIDVLTEKVRSQLGEPHGLGALHGYGETFWIVDGEVRDAFAGYDARNVEELARKHAAVFPSLLA